MIVGFKPDSPASALGNLVGLLGDDLLAVVFSDEPITKMHDSLPMFLFRFEILMKFCEVHELGSVAYFFPWVPLNEGMSHKQVDICSSGVVPDGVH
jgi:hypothetical protein